VSVKFFELLIQDSYVFRIRQIPGFASTFPMLRAAAALGLWI
jgi:hypothetical protein